MYRAILGLVLVAIGTTSTLAGAQSWVFETASARMTIEGNGTLRSLLVSGQERLKPGGQPLAAVSVGGSTVASSSLRCSGALCHVTFGSSAISADYRITATRDYFVVELLAVHGSGIDSLTLLQMSTQRKMNTGGNLLAIRWDDSFALGLVGVTQDVQTADSGQRLFATVYPEFGMEDRRVVLVALPVSRFLQVMEEVEQSFRIISPPPMLGGTWPKVSPLASSNYLFTDMTEANADDIIRYAKDGDIPYILILADTWAASMGSYLINSANYPHGEAGLKGVIDKCHTAGIRVGLHMLTSEVSKNDALVHPVPDPGLLKAGHGVLSASISGHQTSFSIEAPLTGDQLSAADLQIGNEILHCAHSDGVDFSQCQRGYVGTIAAAHSSGAEVARLYKVGDVYLADLRSPLVKKIASRTASLINNLGFDMVDFDGGELNAADGPFWYWGGVEQYDTWKLMHRNVLVQGSGITPWSWHFFTRGLSDDFPAVGVKKVFQLEKIDYAWKLNHDAFLPADLGWVGLLDASPDHPATMPDEMELYAARGLSLDSSVGVESTDAELKGNGRSAEMLEILASYRILRGRVSPAVRARLRSGEWHLTPDGQLHPTIYSTQRVALSSGKATVNVNSTFSVQPLRFRFRVDGVVGSGIPLLESSLPVPPPTPGAKMPGMLVQQISFSHPENLLNRSDLSVDLSVAGPVSPDTPAVLDIQLRDTSGELRDYFVDLNFQGEKSVHVSADNGKRMLANFWPVWSNYSFKRADRFFNYRSVQSISLRWMRYPVGPSPQCVVKGIQALAESPVKLNGVVISSSSVSFRIPGVLQSGDYAEYWGDGQIRIFDRNNFLVRVVKTNSAILLKHGLNSLQLSPDSSGALITFTAITMGKGIH